MHLAFISDRGKSTRSQLLDTLTQQDGLTRNELVAASGLTYEQVRRQTKNLCIDGAIESRPDRTGARRYFIKTQSLVSSFLLVCLLGWAVPVEQLFSETRYDAATQESTL